MSDITTDLRGYAKHTEESGTRKILKKAANEIERLRKDVTEAREAARWCFNGDQHDPELECAPLQWPWLETEPTPGGESEE